MLEPGTPVAGQRQCAGFTAKGQGGVRGCYSPFLKCRAQASARIHRPSARFALIGWFSHPELVTEEGGTDLGRS